MRIGELAAKHGLSRSTLLHYHRIGLLKASGRTHADYRTYTEADAARLDQICLLRRAGLSLADIALILSDGTAQVPALERRLLVLDREMEALKAQQRFVADLLRRQPVLPVDPPLQWAAWVALVKGAGLDLDALRAWHAEFQRRAPERHAAFLQRLRVPERERQRLRSWGIPLPD